MRGQIIAHSGLPRRSRTKEEHLIFQSGHGAYVTDAEDRRYIDFILGYGSVILGHSPRPLVERVNQSLHTALHLPGYSVWHYRFIERLTEGANGEFCAAIFKTGSEAVTAAFRLCSAQSGKKGIIRCGFVGWHDAAVARTPRWHETLQSSLRSEERYCDGFRGVEGLERVYNWTSLDLKDLSALIASTRDHVGTMIIDAYQAEFCGFSRLSEAIQLCRANDIWVIMDETKTGGRVSRLGVANSEGWDVDGFILGKALANGAPLSVLLGTPELMSLSEKLRITGTFSQEVSAVFFALATLDEMRDSDGYVALREVGTNVARTFNVAIKEASLGDVLRAEVRFEGTMFELVFSEPVLGNWSKRNALCEHMAEQGILLLQGHASYVSLAHRELDHGALGNSVSHALRDWALHAL